MSFNNPAIFLYGLREILLVSLDGQTQVALPAAQTLTFTETITSDQLRGDDVIKSVVSFIEGVEFTLEAGGISLEAYGMLTGEAVNTTGVTPDRVTQLTRHGATNFPFLRLYGRALGDGADDLHMLILKGKLNTLEGNFANQQFYVTSATGQGIANDNNDVFILRRYETAQPVAGNAYP